jgi:hypothetical protein
MNRRQYPPRDLMPVEQISAMLAARILDLCRYLLPNGVVEGPEFRVGSCSGEAGRSMAVHLRGHRAGTWADFSSGTDRGDALDLVRLVACGGDAGRAVAWAKSWLGLDGTDHDALQRTRRSVDQQERLAKTSEEDDERKRKNMMAIWLSSQQSIKDTPVEAYLAGRGIPLDVLGRQPRALRFHSGLRHPETQRHHPAMVATIQGLDGKQRAIHRTWLQVEPDGRVIKLQGVSDSKLSLGRYRGGFIALWRGASGKPIKSAEPSEEIAISEGIEDGLSAALAKPSLRVIAAVSGSNMLNIDLPPGCGVLLVGQNDAADSKAAAMWAKVIARFQSQGRRVRIARPPAGVKDINDVVRGLAATPNPTEGEKVG